MQRIRTNCPRDCYDACGIEVEVQDTGKIRVLGDPEHPISRGRLCSKCAIAYNGVWQDEGERLLYPLRRTGPKGTASFARISWEEALTTVAEQLRSTMDTHGAEAILHSHYSGTLSLIAHFFPNRLFAHLGASEVDPDTICNAAGHVAWHLLFGTSGMGFDPRTARDASCIVVWGANPAHSAPHMHDHWLVETSARTIVIDPLRTETATSADLHLQLRPGSDAALAFGLLHQLQRLDAFDAAFIAEHTLGADEIMDTIARCDADWTEQHTGVPRAQLEEAARLYAAGPAMLWCGQGVQRQRTGGNVMRAAGLLPALTGNVGKPGTGFCYLNYTPAFAGIDLGKLAGAGLASGRGKSVSHMDLATRLGDGDEFRSLVVWNTNPLASAPDQQRLRAAFEREDLFTVVADCFLTDTARYADIVLPAASFLEFDDLTFGYFNLLLGAQSAVRSPLGESLPNQEIFRRLARAMGLEEPALYETDAALIEQMMEEWDPGFDFAELQRRGAVYITEEPMPMFADLAFDTPSGRIEIASANAEAMGLPRTPEALADGAPGDGELRLLTPASRWRLNDSYGNDPHIDAQAKAAMVWLNTAEAARRGLSDGAAVSLANDTGSIELILGIDDSIPDGTALSFKGRWPSREGSGRNVNFLHAPVKADMGDSTSVHSTVVRLSGV